MQQEFSRSRADKPKIAGPKPTIASKPKFVPPVNLKGLATPRGSFQVNPHHGRSAAQPDVLSSEVLQGFTNIPQQKTSFKPYGDKGGPQASDKQQAVEDTQHQGAVLPKAPNSPSTVSTVTLSQHNKPRVLARQRLTLYRAKDKHLIFFYSKKIF